MTTYKKKKVAAAAFTFLMALSSISGAAISGSEQEQEDHFEIDGKDLLFTKSSDYPASLTISISYLNYQNLVQIYNPGLDDQKREKIYRLTLQAAETYQLPPELILSIMACESEFKPHLIGRLDDTGLMQIRFRFAPSWASAMGISAPNSKDELSAIETNIEMGAFIMRYLLDTFDQDLKKALVAYNAGENFVKRKIAAGEPLPTRYIERINFFHHALTGQKAVN